MSKNEGYTLMLKPFPQELAQRGRARAALRKIPLREYMRMALQEKLRRDERQEAARKSR